MAKGFEVTGFVYNLADGRVQLYAEGTEDEVLAFQAEVESDLKSYIRKCEIETGNGIRMCKNFIIKN